MSSFQFNITKYSFVGSDVKYQGQQIIQQAIFDVVRK